VDDHGDAQPSAALLDSDVVKNGKVLVRGGIIASFTKHRRFVRPGRPAWTPTGSLFHARYGHTATLLKNGKVLVAGGL